MTTQYRIPELSSFQWQQAVKSRLADPPGGPAKGDRYIVIATGSGAWVGKEKYIAWYDGSTWQFDLPVAGWATWSTADSKYYTYVTGAAWTAWDPSTFHTQNTDTGTTSTTFQLDSGNSGPKIKNNSGVLEARNAADGAYADIKGKDIVAGGNITDGSNATSPSQIKTAYDSRATYDSDLKCLVFSL